jgi:rod shape-determining protein MreC
LPVASVVRIERDAEHSFARVVCKPAGGVDRGRYVLVLSNEPKAVPARPDEVQPGKDRRTEKSRRTKGLRDKEQAKDAAKDSAPRDSAPKDAGKEADGPR